MTVRILNTTKNNHLIARGVGITQEHTGYAKTVQTLIYMKRRKTDEELSMVSLARIFNKFKQSSQRM